MITPPLDRTLVDSVVRQIRKKIMLGQLPRGERLTEARLSDELEVSRSTVREALRRLEAESLVETSSHRGARVADLTPDDAVEISEIHAMLGVQAVQHLTLPISDELRAKLLRITDEMGTLHFPEDVDHFIELDTQFHRALFEAAGQPRVLQVWSGVSALLGIIVSMSLRMFQIDGAEIARRHEEIIEALSQSKTERAALSIRQHYQSNESRLRRLMVRGRLAGGTTENGRTGKE